MSMVFLGFGLRDGGGGVYACVEGVPTDCNGWVEGFGVEIFKVDRIVRPCQGIGHCLLDKGI